MKLLLANVGGKEGLSGRLIFFPLSVENRHRRKINTAIKTEEISLKYHIFDVYSLSKYYIGLAVCTLCLYTWCPIK